MGSLNHKDYTPESYNIRRAAWARNDGGRWTEPDRTTDERRSRHVGHDELLALALLDDLGGYATPSVMEFSNNLARDMAYADIHRLDSISTDIDESKSTPKNKLASEAVLLMVGVVARRMSGEPELGKFGEDVLCDSIRRFVRARVVHLNELLGEK